MRVAEVFCPGHITGFFEIRDFHKELIKRGSRGAGVSIDKGIITKVKFDEGLKGVHVYINGERSDAPVTKKVVEYFVRDFGLDGGLEIHHSTQIPIGCGFGASGAGALSTSFALNLVLKSGLTALKAAKYAHIAEVECKTGLGDVITEFYGGFEIRRREGAPGVGLVDRIMVPKNVSVLCVSMGPLETKSILSDDGIRKRINSLGRDMVDILLKDPTIENMMKLSRKFSEDMGLMDEFMKEIIREVEKNGLMGSMVMLGRSIFAVGIQEKVNMVHKLLKREYPDIYISISKENLTGPIVLRYEEV
ncbi:MAG: pantoate kinase [Candidatus Asgardarchaeia archaeon]